MSRAKKTTPEADLTSTALPLTPGAELPARNTSKLETLVALLQSPEGATIAALCDATGWQSHSIRGAMAGSLKRKGYAITSTKAAEAPRRYRIEVSA